MSRYLPSSVINAFNSNAFNYASLVYFERASTILKFTDYGVNLTANNTEYVATSLLVEIGSVSESAELRVNDMFLTFSGADQTLIQSFLSNSNFIKDRVRIFKAVVSDNNSVTGRYLLFDGRVADYSIEESETESIVKVTVASHWSDFEKVNNRKTNMNSQRLYFPNDVGFQYASKIVKDLRWGRQS